MTNVVVQLSDEEFAFLERSARANGISNEEFVIRCIERFLAEHPPVAPE